MISTLNIRLNLSQHFLFASFGVGIGGLGATGLGPTALGAVGLGAVVPTNNAIANAAVRNVVSAVAR